MQTSRLIILSVAATGILSGCSDVTGPNLFDGTVGFTPNAAAAVSKVIGQEGGSITAKSSDGTTFTLTVPESAMPGDVAKTITVTPIASFAGMPLRNAVGVQLSPSGLRFMIPLELTIARPSGVAGRIVGFGAKDDGTEFFFRPAVVSGSSVTVAVNHFSTAGAGAYENVLLDPNAVRSNSLMLNKIMIAIFNYSDDDALTVAIMTALQDEYAFVKAALQVAMNPNKLDDEQATLDLLTVYADWRHVVRTELPKVTEIPKGVLARIQDGIAADLKEADSLAAAVFRSRVNHANSLCKDKKSLDQASAVFRWQDLAKRYGIATAENGLDDSSIALGLCVRVAYQTVAFPQTPTEGQVAQLRFVAGLVYEGSSPIYTPPLSVQVTPTGTTQLSPSIGLTNSTGEYTDGFTPAKAGAQIVLGLHTCVDAAQYRRLAGVCADQQVTRGVKPVEISVTPTAALLNPGKTAQFSGTVTNTSNTGVTWSATGGTISSGGLYTAGSTAGDYEVVARSVADTSKKATAKITIVPVSTPAQSFTGTYKGTGTWIRKSFNAGTQSYEDKEFSGNFEVRVTHGSGNELGVVIKVFTTPSVPTAYDYYEFGGTIGSNGTGTATQTRECFYNGVTFAVPFPWTSCHVIHHNFTLTISIANSKASGSFGAKELGDPGVFTFTSLPKQ